MSLASEPTYFRASAVSGRPSSVERNGGQYGFGVIRGVSVITRGEALGHGLWVDAEFLQDVSDHLNASGNGVKSRFTHPGLSSDGVGSKLGKLHEAKVIGDQVFADLHFQEAATKTPDGDLADYVMSLAEETPEDFGLSIVFEHDANAMESHEAQNSVMQAGRSIFVSPDEDNQNNYPHARLAKLRAGDVVDSPAANPEGLFKRGQEAAQEADAFLQYTLGLSDAKPALSAFNVDGDRAAQFVSRFLERHQLSIQKGGDPVSGNENAVENLPSTRKQFTQELQSYSEAFGHEKGGQWFTDGVPFSEAQARYIDFLNGELASRDAEITELNERLESLDVGEEAGPEFSTPAAVTKKTFGGAIRIQGKNYSNN